MPESNINSGAAIRFAVIGAQADTSTATPVVQGRVVLAGVDVAEVDEEESAQENMLPADSTALGSVGHKNSLLLVEPLRDRLLVAEHLRGKQEAMDEEGGELLSLHFEVLSHLHDVDFRVEEALFSRGRALGLGQLGKASVLP